MNEEDKMLAGELYNSRDKQLLNKLIRAKKLCNKYNKLDVEDIEKCNEIIRELFSISKFSGPQPKWELFSNNFNNYYHLIYITKW